MNYSDKFSYATLKLIMLILIALLAQAALLSGCSTQTALMGQSDQNQELTKQVAEAIRTTESRIAKAQADGVEKYSPDQMEKAKDALAEAQRYNKRIQANPENANKSISLFFSDTVAGKALSLIAEADAALSQAETNKQQADALFEDANENFVWLEKFQAPVQFRDEYEDLQRDERYLIGYVTLGKMETARLQMPKFLQQQRALEVEAAQRFYLHDLSDRVAREKGYTLDRFAPLSYSASIDALNTAKEVVAKDTRDEAAILAAKENAQFSFNMAHAVATDMQQLLDMDRRDMERWLMLMATKLNELGNSLGANDVRDQELLKQLDLLAAVAKQQHDLAEANAQQVAKAEAENKDRVEEKAINDRMTQLEQNLADQVKALSDQLNAMKAENKSAQAAE